MEEMEAVAAMLMLLSLPVGSGSKITLPAAPLPCRKLIARNFSDVLGG
jgi:hypothetical protein